MEYWNDGIMGSGKMGQWFIGKIRLDMEIKNVNRLGNVLLKSTFQYSIIPSFHVRGKTSGLKNYP